MMIKIHEDDIENMVIDLLQSQGYDYLPPERLELERTDENGNVDLTQVVLKNRLKDAVDKLNPLLPTDVKEQAIKKVLNIHGSDIVQSNETLHNYLVNGVSIEYRKNRETVGANVKIIDFTNFYNNNFVVTNQFTVIENNKNRRPDVVLLVNGMPFVVIELKNAGDEKATLKKAFTQLQNYKSDIPSLFTYNAVLVISDGLDVKAGSLTAGWDRFMAWKSVDGIREDKSVVPQIETLIKGMLRKDVLLDLIRFFTLFEKSEQQDVNTGLTTTITIKKIAAYHQYYAVNKAIESTIRAMSHNLKVSESPSSYGLPSVKEQPLGDHKIGVIWHTQGSGKSLSMVFYAGKLIVRPEMKNPTIVVITDRNDLDNQLFDTFASNSQFLRQQPVQAKSREHLKSLLKTTGGGIVFTTIQKFYPEDINQQDFELLSSRENIIVIADEAHRSQYGFGARNVEKAGQVYTRYGFAKYLRDALPNASFIGFTGTPIEKEDRSTPAVFGNYIDIYDIEQAIEDGATVPIYYESRLVKVHIKEELKEQIDEEVASITENEETLAVQKAKAKWTQLEAIVGHKERLKLVAKDIVSHFEERQKVFEGKAMIVVMSRRIAVNLYDEIIKIKPEWHSPDKAKGVVKVVMTSSSSDPQRWQIYRTDKQERRMIAQRFKDPNDPLKLVIVRDMWLTGFDVPCLHTMYIDKPMKGHALMQAIARVNRVYKDKPGGLIVDYIGIATDLKKALAIYTESGGKGKPTIDIKEAINLMQEKFEIVEQMFFGFDYKRYFKASTREKLHIILEAQEFILGLENGKDRFVREVTALSKAFALAIPSDQAMKIKEAVAFFQAVKARLIKFEPQNVKSDTEVETAIRQLIDKAVVADGVIDIFDAAGIKKPEISVLSDEFLEEIKGMKRKNLALELLKKLLNDEINVRSKKNFIQSRKLSEMLKNVIKRYQNNLLTTAEVINELIKLAKDIKQADKRGEKLGLSDEELAFYDALSSNKSAQDVLGDETLRELARLLVERVRANLTIDWTIKESARAKLRVIVKRLLRKYGYPPDAQKMATDYVLKQAELLGENIFH